MIVAIDDVFVLPIPKSRKVIGFFRPDVIASEFRDEAVRRLGVTTSGWNAIAIGAGGQPGLGLAAATEQAAVEGALAECGRNARDCRVIAIGGPFWWNPGPRRMPWYLLFPPPHHQRRSDPATRIARLEVAN
jgi:adenylate cyclase